MRYFLDSNVFMYAAGREHPLKAPCLAVLKRVTEDQLDALTSTEILQEILYRYGAIGELDRGIRLARLTVEQVGAAVLPVTLAGMQRAFEIAGALGTAIKSRDAVHAATMLENGITHIISADSHFDRIPGITRVDPREASRAKNGLARGGS